MAPRTTSEHASRESATTIDDLVAGQARSDARFDEVFRRLGTVEAAAGEARDAAKEVVSTLRAQDLLAKMAEQRSEYRNLVSDLREDVVKANNNLKEEIRGVENSSAGARSRISQDIAGVSDRVDELELTKAKGAGMFLGARWLFDLLKIAAGAGGGAIIVAVLQAASHHAAG